MGRVQQAVLEFDEEVRAPWRPRLVPDLAERAEVLGAAPSRLGGGVPSRRSPSRVGACRPAIRSCEQMHGRPVPAGVLPSVRPRPSRPGGPTRLRLTRRARRLAVLLMLAVGVMVGLWLAPLLNGGSELRLAGESSVVVQSGDTLWSIASALGGEGDVRVVIDEIERINHLDGAALVPGQILQLP